LSPVTASSDHPSLSTSAVSDNCLFNSNQEKDENEDFYKRALSCSSTEKNPSTRTKPHYQPAWTSNSKQAVGPGSGAKRRAKRITLSTRNSKNRRKAHSDSFSSSKGSSSESDSENARPSKGRASHNLTERRYRSRLNGQFESLLLALPPNLAAEADGAVKESDQPEKRISKSEVLILAKQHIEALERVREELEERHKTLENDFERTKGLWVDLGGKVVAYGGSLQD